MTQTVAAILKNANFGNTKFSFEIVEDKNASVPTFKLRGRLEGKQGQPRVFAEGPTQESVAAHVAKVMEIAKAKGLKRNEIADKANKDLFERVSYFPKADRKAGGGRRKEFDKMVGAFGVTFEMLARLKTEEHTSKESISEIVRLALDEYLPSIADCSAELDKLMPKADPAEGSETENDSDDTANEGSETSEDSTTQVLTETDPADDSVVTSEDSTETETPESETVTA